MRYNPVVLVFSFYFLGLNHGCNQPAVNPENLERCAPSRSSIHPQNASLKVKSQPSPQKKSEQIQQIRFKRIRLQKSVEPYPPDFELEDFEFDEELIDAFASVDDD